MKQVEFHVPHAAPRSIDDRPSGIAKRFSLPAVSLANPDSNPESEAAVLALLELENSGLRRLVVELLHKNQQLRDQIDLTQETLKSSPVS